jgi:hypothetical protein
VRLINAQIRYYFRIDPSTLSDDEWAQMWQDLSWVRRNEYEESLRNNPFAR